MPGFLSRWMAVSLLTIFSLISVGAQAAKPIYNVDDQSVARADGKALTLEQVRTAIIAAGAARGWSISPAGGNSLLASLAVRSHRAEAMIEYTTTSFSIHYVSSINLDYEKKRDGSELIHRNYNKWINNLRIDVMQSLSILKD